MSQVIVIDGRIVDAASATISVLDRGLLYGDGLFEVVRTWNGRVVELAAHLDRLEESARFLRLPVDRASLVRHVELALHDASQRDATSQRDAKGTSDWRIRIVVTRGPGALSMPVASAGPGHDIVIVEPLGVIADAMSLAVVEWSLPRRAGRGHKTLAYLDHVIAREMARELGADDAVRLDADGRVAEGGTCNVFAVRANVVHASDAGGVLPGVTAARVRDLCRRSDIPMVVGPIDLQAFLTADEVFVTSAVRGVVAVTRLISDGERALPVGVVTRRIRAAYAGEMAAL